MDVVKTQIEKVGGIVNIQSKPDKGTTVRIKIPLTLAIIPALIVTSGGDRYAIPQISLVELVRLEGEEKQEAIEMVQSAPVYRLRGNLLPLVYLNDELALQTSPAAEDIVNIIVLQAGYRQFGLVVDEVNDTQEIVVKPLGKQLKDVSSFAGATIMGDGKVALILDVLNFAQHAHVITDMETRDRILADKGEENHQQLDDDQALLLFQAGDDGRLAIPLSKVARLEEFPFSAIERAGNHDVVQYRGQILPLVNLSSALSGTTKQRHKKDGGSPFTP